MADNEFKFCKNCGKKIKISDKFCSGCGKKCDFDEKDLKCFVCGANLKPEAKFCRICGKKVQEIVQEVVEETVEESFEYEKNPKKKSKKKKQTIKPISLIAGILIITLSFSIYYNREKIFFNNPINGNGTVRQSASVSGSKAIDITPIKGLRITAEENAMDKDRSFKVKKLEDASIYKYITGLKQGEFPILGFDIDAGMTEENIFPGSVNIRFNLRDFGVPENLWSSLAILRIEDNGDRTNLVTSISGNELICSTRQNCAFVITVTSLLVGVPLSCKIINDSTNKFNYLGDSCIDDKYLQYHIYWAATMPSGNQAEVDRVNGEIKKIYAKYGLVDISKQIEKQTYPNAYEYAARFSKMFEDAEYKKLDELKNSIEWKKDNLWPERVVLAVESLEKADEYLREVRTFKEPGYVMDILCLNTWPGSFGDSALALEAGNPFQNAFIYVNLSDNMFREYMSYVLPKTGKTYTPKKSIDDLKDGMNITMVHELFHAFQDEYLTVRRNKYLWFMEAAAVTLEYEANKYYVEKEWNKKSDILTDRDAWETFRNQLNDKSNNDKILINHGYTASSLFEYLRDNQSFNKSDKKYFVENLMESFSGFMSDTISAIYDSCNASEEELGSQFNQFSTNKAEEMYKNVAAKVAKGGDNTLLQGIINPLDEAHPLYNWRLEDFKPLSAEFRILSTESMSTDALKNSYVYIINGKNDSFKKFNVHHNIRTTTAQSGVKWAAVKDEVKGYKADTIKSLPIQRVDINTSNVNKNMSSETFIPSDMTFKVLLMLQPEEVKASIKDNILNVEIKRSKLKDILSKDPVPVSVSYTLYIKIPGLDKPYILNMKDDKQIANIDISENKDIGKSIKKAAESGVKKIDITYRENVTFPDRSQAIPGPESKNTEVQLAGEQGNSDWIGTWKHTEKETRFGKNAMEYFEVTSVTKYIITPYNKDGYKYKVEYLYVVEKTNERSSSIYFANESEDDKNTLVIYSDNQFNGSYYNRSTLTKKDKNTIYSSGDDYTRMLR